MTENTENKPSTSVVPAVPVSAPEAMKNNATQSANGQDGGVAFSQEQALAQGDDDKQRVLLVEDDSFLSTLLKTKLQKAGVEVVLAIDGEQALTVLETYRPQVILLDLILPKRSGFEVLEVIQSDPQLNQVPVIILSNLGQDTDVMKGRQLGAVEYFIKAKTSIDDLVAKIQGFLNAQKS